MAAEVRRVELTDLETLRVLAHPRRQRMVQRLGMSGPMTSAGLGRALGLNTGATSYHLRELAKVGLVEEVPELGRGRERWWRAPRLDLRLPARSAQSPELRSVLDEAVRAELADDFQEFLQHLQASGETDGWTDAALTSRGVIEVAAHEVGEFFDAYVALLNRYRQRPDPDGSARLVATRLLVFPLPDADGPTPTADGRSAPGSSSPPTSRRSHDED